MAGDTKKEVIYSDSSEDSDFRDRQDAAGKVEGGKGR